MELLCLEKHVEKEPELKIFLDPVFDDERVLQNLYFLEKQYLPKFSYFKCVQTEITPEMRRIIAEWLLQVCEADKLDEEVFPSAMNIFDRFLCSVDIKKNQIQLLSCVCLLLACKTRGNEDYISIDKLVNYTDYSVTADEIAAWELFVLHTLEWDILAVTPNDFLKLIIPRLEAKYKHKEELIRKHAEIFISVCITDQKYAFYRPSLIAIASVKVALDGLFSQRTRPVLEQIQNKCRTADLFQFIEQGILKKTYKLKLNKISLMIEDFCEEMKKRKNPNLNTNNQKKSNQNVTKNNQNKSQTKKSTLNQKASNNQKKTTKKSEKKTNSTTPVNNKKVESRD